MPWRYVFDNYACSVTNKYTEFRNIYHGYYLIKYDDTSQVDKKNDYLSNNVLILIILKNIDERDILYVFLNDPRSNILDCRLNK